MSQPATEDTTRKTIEDLVTSVGKFNDPNLLQTMIDKATEIRDSCKPVPVPRSNLLTFKVKKT